MWSFLPLYDQNSPVNLIFFINAFQNVQNKSPDYFDLKYMHIHGGHHD